VNFQTKSHSNLFLSPKNDIILSNIDKYYENSARRRLKAGESLEDIRGAAEKEKTSKENSGHQRRAAAAEERVAVTETQYPIDAGN
jgi:hypothetical protein